MDTRCADRFWVPLCLVIVCGCGGAETGTKSPEAETAVAAPAATTPKPATGTPAQPATIDAEMEQLAREIGEGVSTGKPNTINGAIDWEVLQDRISAGVDAPDKMRQEFIVGLRNGMTFDEQFKQSLGGRGSFDLLRLRLVNGEPRALYRMVLPDSGGVNYLDMLLVRSADGKVRIGDIFMFLAGEDFSGMLRRPFLAALQNSNRGVLDRLTGKENSFVKAMPEIVKMTQAVQRGDAPGAMKIYQALPPDVQKEKMILGLRMRAAQNLSVEEYATAIDELRKEFGDDPSVRLILIDGYVIKQDYPKALECIDALDASIGGDPYLNSLRANIHLLQGDLSAAKEDATKVTTDLPNLFDGQVVALTIALRQQRYDEALAILDLIEMRFGLELDVRNNPEFAGFAMSPQFQSWAERHPESKTAPAEVAPPQ